MFKQEIIATEDGPNARVIVEENELYTGHPASLCIDFTPVHPKEKMLRVFLTRAEANEVATALFHAVNKVGFILDPVSKEWVKEKSESDPPSSIPPLKANPQF